MRVKKMSRNSAFSLIPVRLWKQLVQIVGEKCWTISSKAELHELGEEFIAGDNVIDGNGKFKEESVTCGGVKLK